MIVLKALAILEAAVSECTHRKIDTPEVTEALDFLEPHVRPEWLIPQFRFFLRSGSRIAEARKGRQQVLCATLPGIRDSVKELIEKQMDALARQFATTHDMKINEEIERLAPEYEKLKEPWRFMEK
jgi:hypothetical protein